MGNLALIVTPRNIKLIIILAVALTGAGASLLIRHKGQHQLHQMQEKLDRQRVELTSLSREHQRLSNLLRSADAHVGESPLDDSAELARLRAEAEALRNKTNELANAIQTNSQASIALPSTPAPTRGSPRGGVDIVVSDSDSEEYKHQLYKIGAASPHYGPFNIDAMKDAQNLGESLRGYAVEHGGKLPSSFDEAAQYLFKNYRVPHAAEYEIVFQGSLNDLSNIPQQAVALVRERQLWPTPSGKLGRIYVMANGFVRIVESSDNFQSWEAEHLIPPK